ncbi:hypothetical protein ACI3LY_005515 [Candidozyma auris]|nr:hypothetical protein QG37_03793 [[Candida] auris]
MGYFIIGTTSKLGLKFKIRLDPSSHAFRCQSRSSPNDKKVNESESLNTGKYKPAMKHQVEPGALSSSQALFNPVVIVESDWERRDLVSSSSKLSSSLFWKQRRD